ncbi:MAG: RIFT barrel domain-containing protein [Armatimonadota bacterium]
MIDVTPAINLVAADERGLPAVIGVPFERGAVKDAVSLTAVSPSGKACPCAARPLVQWPDGSVRWALVAVQAQETGTHRITSGDSAMPEQPVMLTEADGTITLDNDLVRVVLATEGAGPIREITALGHAYLARAKDLCFVVNEADTRQESERTLEVLENSPLRARVRVSGAHYSPSGKRLLHYRLDIELWANWPALRLDYHFFNLEPGHDELDIHRIALEWDVNLGEGTRRHFLQSCHGLLFYPREVFNPAPVGICTDEFCGPAHIEDPAMLLDDTEYPKHLRPPLVGTSEWLGLGDERHNLYLRMQDFLQTRPNRLASEGNSVELEFWPASQGMLALPQGRSRRQVVTAVFSDGPLSAAEAERLTKKPVPRRPRDGGPGVAAADRRIRGRPAAAGRDARPLREILPPAGQPDDGAGHVRSGRHPGLRLLAHLRAGAEQPHAPEERARHAAGLPGAGAQPAGGVGLPTAIRACVDEQRIRFHLRRVHGDHAQRTGGPVAAGALGGAAQHRGGFRTLPRRPAAAPRLPAAQLPPQPQRGGAQPLLDAGVAAVLLSDRRPGRAGGGLRAGR